MKNIANKLRQAAATLHQNQTLNIVKEQLYKITWNFNAFVQDSFIDVEIHGNNDKLEQIKKLFKEANLEYSLYILDDHSIKILVKCSSYVRDSNNMQHAWLAVKCPVLHCVAQNTMITYLAQMADDPVNDPALLVLADEAQQLPLSTSASHKRSLYLANMIFENAKDTLDDFFQVLHIKSMQDANKICKLLSLHRCVVNHVIKEYANMNIVSMRSENIFVQAYDEEPSFEEACDLLRQLIQIH